MANYFNTGLPAAPHCATGKCRFMDRAEFGATRSNACAAAPQYGIVGVRGPRLSPRS
jgi:hypothetical protein